MDQTLENEIPILIKSNQMFFFVVLVKYFSVSHYQFLNY